MALAPRRSHALRQSSYPATNASTAVASDANIGVLDRDRELGPEQLAPTHAVEADDRAPARQGLCGGEAESFLASEGDEQRGPPQLGRDLLLGLVLEGADFPFVERVRATTGCR